jgi:chorismate mutase
VLYGLYPASRLFISLVGRTEGEDQENYGSMGTCDVAALQALLRRIHYGKFVAEAKFRQEPERFDEMIRANDREGIASAITNAKVERASVAAVEVKGQDLWHGPMR